MFFQVCWQVECNKGHADEKHYFAQFVRELSEAFKPRGLLLSSAVSPSKTVIDAGYEVKTLSKYFDWISVMAYDYHGQWDKQTGILLTSLSYILFSLILNYIFLCRTRCPHVFSPIGCQSKLQYKFHNVITESF